MISFKCVNNIDNMELKNGVQTPKLEIIKNIIAPKKLANILDKIFLPYLEIKPIKAKSSPNSRSLNYMKIL